MSKRSLRAFRLEDVPMIREAILKLQQARDMLAVAGAGKAAAYVRRALKSAEGAYRHVIRVKFAAERETSA